MRKNLLLFIAALCATVVVNAKTITLEPGEKKIEAVKETLVDGDVIELQTGTYTEWSSLEFTTKVTIKAAEGATPTLALYNWQIKNDFEIDGVEIKNVSKDNYLFRITSEVAGTVAFKNCSMQLHDEVTSLQSYIRVEKAVGTLTIDNCVFKEFNATLANQVSHIKLGAAVGKLTINNCIFKDNAKIQETILAAQSYSITNFSMTNCTAYNCGGVNNDLAIFCEHATNVYVDYCTFYNCGKRVIYFTNKDGVKESYLVQNCVVVNSEVPSTNDYCIAIYAGEVKNCVYNNVNAPRGGDATVNGCINADPLFADPANGDFNFSIFSPLCFAATDGKHIGDPRWEAQSGAGIDLPTDATPVVLDKANVGAVSSDMTYYGDDAYFDFGPNDSSNDTLRWAKWLVNIKKCAYSVSAELTSENSYKLVLDVIDPSTGAVVLTSDTAKTPLFNTIDFSGLEEKSYILRLKNREGWSKVKVKSLTFTYAGGAVVDVPGTLPNEDAILGGNAKVKVDEEGYICFSGDGNVPNCYAKWNANFTKKGKFEVSLSVSTTNGHQLAIQVLDGENVISETTPKWLDASGNLVLGIISVPQQGNYTIKFINTLSSSAARVKDITLTYAGGAVIDVPATLPNEEALLTGRKISRTEDGIAWNDNGNVTEDYATWNISVAEGGDYLVTMAVRTGETSEHEFFINIYDGESQQVGETITETTKTPITLTAGTYTVHLGNNEQWSSAVMASVAIKSASGTVVEMPGTLQADDALLGGDDKVKVDGDGYICFSKDENVPNCWATWQTNWVKTGTYDVILDVNATNGHKLVVEVLDGETVIETFEYGYSEKSGKLSIGKFELSETKSYTIRLTNGQTWSNARIKSIAFIPFITIDNDDEDVDFTEYENQFVSVQLNRTFTGGMYNPICVPFAVNEKKLEAIFGVNKAYYLDVSNTYMDGQKLFINLKADGGIYQGVPYFVAPATNVVNPIFHNVQISQVNAQATNVSDVIKLQGNYSKEELPKPTLSLLLGANNTLFFPSDETPYVKSMRAYFELPSEEVKKTIRHISLSDGYNAPTWMPIVGAETERPNGKFIRDGRFVIVREGKEYGILGVEK